MIWYITHNCFGGPCSTKQYCVHLNVINLTHVLGVLLRIIRCIPRLLITFACVVNLTTVTSTHHTSCRQHNIFVMLLSNLTLAFYMPFSHLSLLARCVQSSGDIGQQHLENVAIRILTFLSITSVYSNVRISSH